MPFLFPNRYVCSWPNYNDARCERRPTGEVLIARHDDDAHFVAYEADYLRRIGKKLWTKPSDVARLVNARMLLAVFDIDAPGKIVTDAWAAAEVDKVVDRLLAAHPNGYVYSTRGGYRIVYALPEPVQITTLELAAEWKASYSSWVRYLARRFDIKADDSCSDWTRLYRAPNVVREGVRDEVATFGDPFKLGSWAPALTKRDRVVAKAEASYASGEVEPVPIANPLNGYGRARLASAIDYLERNAPLSIEGQCGRNTFFRVCIVLTRRQRLPLDLAADAVEAIYNPRLLAAGTTTWSREEILDRLDSARTTASEVPAGDIWDEETWDWMNETKEVAA